MDTGVRDLEVVCFQANSTWINDIGGKELSNRPIYIVFNIHNLDMILQLKDDFQSVLRSLGTLMFIDIINGSLDGLRIDVIR